MTKEQIAKRLGRMYAEMNAAVTNSELRCKKCGRTGPPTPSSGGSYFRDGWPECCSETMALVTADSNGRDADA